MAEPALPSNPTAQGTRPTRSTSPFRDTFQSLKVQQFRRYMVSFVGSGIGFQSMLVVTGWLAWDLTRSEFMLGAVLLMSGIAQVFIAPIGGVVADRISHKPIMVAMQGLILANGVVLGILVATDQIATWHLFASSGFFGAANSMHMPSRQSFVFEMVGKEHLANALALNAGAMSSMRLIGPAIGGVMIAHLGAEAVYFTVAGGYVLSITVLTLFINVRRAHIEAPVEGPLTAFTQGVTYLLREPVLKWLVIGLMGATLIGLPFRELLPAIADVLGQGPEGVGLLLSMAGLGALCGSLAIAAWSNMTGRGRVYIASGFFWGGGVILLSVMPNLAGGMAAMILLGAISANYNTLNSILVQTNVEEAYRGRVLSFLMVMFGLHLVGAVIIGVIAEYIGIRWALAGSGVAMVLFVTYLGFGRSEIRRLD